MDGVWVEVVVLSLIKGGLCTLVSELNRRVLRVLPNTELHPGEDWIEETKDLFEKIYEQKASEPVLKEILVTDEICVIVSFIPLLEEPISDFVTVTPDTLSILSVPPYRTVAEHYFKSLNIKEEK